MAIVRLSKVTLYGPDDEKDEVVNGLQDLGCMHLLDLGKNASNARPGTNVAAETHQALKFLRSCPIRRRSVKNDGEFRLHEVVEEAVDIEQRQERLRQESDELAAAIKDLEPWGDFQTPGEGELGDLCLWFYVVPLSRLRSLKDSDMSWQIVSRDHRFAYVVVISPTECEDMPAPRTILDQRPLSELRRQLEGTEGELEVLHWRRIALTRWIGSISRSIALADDEVARQRAQQQTRDDTHLFAVRGWAPLRDLDRLRSFAATKALALTIERPTAEDLPPTLLENRPLAAGGQEAVTFYTTPAYDGWDPSSVVFVSFSVFFAMIMADAGYAMVLGAVLLLLWRKFGRSIAGRRIRSLALAVVLTSVTYGVLIGSYFGISPTGGWFLRSLHRIDAADTGLMMRISIGIGVMHLALANLAVAWNVRWSWKMLSSLGWIAVLLGGLAFGFGKSGIEPSESLAAYGGWLLLAGGLSVLVFSSDRPMVSSRLHDYGWRLLDGLKSLASVPRAFGDVLSYLRLFALGLASAQLAATFNELTYQASCCVGVGSLLAVLVAIFGHGLNLALVVMSGVVHGLRLNCIEFFGWGLSGEGYPYQPFCRRAT